MRRNNVEPSAAKRCPPGLTGHLPQTVTKAISDRLAYSAARRAWPEPSLLAARAALYCGAGRVYVGALDERLAVDPVCPELMIVAAEALPALPHPACLIAGPGMGDSNVARRVLAQALRVEHALLLDADA
jgi:NAD(P)H-hydrate repair Nnr-like enzyme with NAD(P)H-hydrate dehydratase domain